MENNMIKNVIVTFQYNPETDTVSDVLCSVDGIEKKKRTTKKKETVIEEMAKEPLITLEPTKLAFNNKIVSDMGIEYEDRIVIKWEKAKDKKTLFPIIGKDISFDEEGSGNKVTKANTIGYKGKQNAVLAEFGTQFTIESYKEGIWKLISTTSPTTCKVLADVIKSVEKVTPELLVESGDETEIDEMQFTLTI